MTDRATEQAKYARAYEDQAYRMGWFRQAALRAWLRTHTERDEIWRLRARFLDVGCGRGESLAIAAEVGIGWAHGLEVDPVIALGARPGVTRMVGVHWLPIILREPTFMPDLVTCLDVLEHVPEADSLLGLRELIRVTRRALLVSVAWNPSVWHGVELHINRHEAPWWLERLREAAAEVGGATVAQWSPPVRGAEEETRFSAWFEVLRKRGPGSARAEP